MKINRKIYLGLACLFILKSSTLWAQNVIQIPLNGIKYQESSSNTVYQSAYLKFLVKPNNDAPEGGVVRVFKDGSRGDFACRGCSVDYKLDAEKVNVYNQEGVVNLLVSQFKDLSDQSAKVVIDSDFNVVALYFNEIIFER